MINHCFQKLKKILFTDLADAIDSRNVSHVIKEDAKSEVLISWKDPVYPNGLIILYEIEMLKVDLKDVRI